MGYVEEAPFGYEIEELKSIWFFILILVMILSCMKIECFDLCFLRNIFFGFLFKMKMNKDANKEDWQGKKMKN